MYKSVFGIDFGDVKWLYEAVLLSHDCVHRAGYGKDGNEAPLTVGSIQELIDRCRALVKMMEDATGFFDDLNVMLVALSSVTIAAELHNGRVPRDSAGDYITVECKHLPLEVRIPLVGPIAVALAEKKPDRIELTVVDRDPALGEEVGGTRGLSAVIDAVFQPFFTNFYELYIQQVRDKFGNSDTAWPESWQMGWVVRNAVAHNGCVYFRSPVHPSVEWRELSISTADNGTEVLGGFLNWADLLMLAFDTEEALTGVKLPRA